MKNNRYLNIIVNVYTSSLEEDNELESDNFEKSIRPLSLSEYVGQKEVKENLDIQFMTCVDDAVKIALRD